MDNRSIKGIKTLREIKQLKIGVVILLFRLQSYKTDGCDHQIFCKGPPNGTRILFCGHGPNNFLTKLEKG